jgi:hypothetical protein
MEAGLMAEFETAEGLLTALGKLREKGYRDLDAFVPHPVHGLDEALHLSRSRLPLAIFPLALGAAVFAFVVQWYCNAWLYPINVGGRPAFAAPAFVPITFETMVLVSGIASLLLLFWILKLPRLSHPVLDVEGFERATVDRFFAAVDRRDPQFEAQKTQKDLLLFGALKVTPFGDAP